MFTCGTRVVVIGFTVLLAGCASHAGPEPIQGNLVIAVKRADNVPPGSLFLKPVPGGLLGTTADVEMFRSRIGQERIEIPSRRLSARLDHHAVPARSDAANPGELAQPRNVRVARVGTFYEPASRNEGCNNFRTGLQAGYPASTVLLYVDRPATVRGVRYAAPYIMNYQLEFPVPGLYAVQLRTRGMIVTQRVVNVAAPFVATVKRVPCT